MKKDYEKGVANYRNIPNLDLYTWMIGASRIAMAINIMLLGLRMYLLELQSSNIVFLTIGAGFSVILSMIGTVKSSQAGNRDKTAVIIDIVCLSVVSIYIIVEFAFQELVYIYIAEILVLVAIFFKKRK